MRFRSPSRITFLLWGVLAIAGCTSLKSYQAGDSGTVDDTKHLNVGLIPYSLPRTTLVVTATYLLTSCDTTQGVNITATASVDTEIGPDPDASYYIDSGAFAGLGPLKTSDIKVDRYPTGILQDINGTLSDQTGAILSGALSVALNAGATFAKGGFFDQIAPCNEPFVTALGLLKTDQAKLNDATQTGPTALPASVLASLQAEISALTKTLTITAVRRIDWTTDDFKDGNTVIKDFASPIGAWFSSGKMPPTAKSTIDPSNLEIESTLASSPDTANNVVSGTASKIGFSKSKPIDGLVYRIPVPMHVRVCYGKCDTGKELQNTTNVAWEKSGILISQLGRALVAPLHNGLFQDTNLIVAQDANGTLSNIEFKNTSTIATFLNGLSSVLTSEQTEQNNALTANASALNAQSTAATTQANVAVTNAGLSDVVLQKQADCLTQQAAIIKAGGTPKTSC